MKTKKIKEKIKKMKLRNRKEDYINYVENAKKNALNRGGLWIDPEDYKKLKGGKNGKNLYYK